MPINTHTHIHTQIRAHNAHTARDLFRYGAPSTANTASAHSIRAQHIYPQHTRPDDQQLSTIISAPSARAKQNGLNLELFPIWVGRVAARWKVRQRAISGYARAMFSKLFSMSPLSHSTRTPTGGGGGDSAGGFKCDARLDTVRACVRAHPLQIPFAIICIANRDPTHSSHTCLRTICGEILAPVRGRQAEEAHIRQYVFDGCFCAFIESCKQNDRMQTEFTFVLLRL